MGIRYLAPSKPHGQELLAHNKLATSFLAIYIGLLTQLSVPLDLRGLHAARLPCRQKPGDTLLMHPAMECPYPAFSLVANLRNSHVPS